MAERENRATGGKDDPFLKAGWKLPRPLVAATRKLARDKSMSGKDDWKVVSAALAMFLRAGEVRQNAMIAAVNALNSPGQNFEDLLVTEPLHHRGGRKRGASSAPGESESPGIFIRLDYETEG